MFLDHFSSLLCIFVINIGTTSLSRGLAATFLAVELATMFLLVNLVHSAYLSKH